MIHAIGNPYSLLGSNLIRDRLPRRSPIAASVTQKLMGANPIKKSLAESESEEPIDVRKV